MIHQMPTTERQVFVDVRNVYGNEAVYPSCEITDRFAEMLGKKTLSHRDMQHIEALGFTISTPGLGFWLSVRPNRPRSTRPSPEPETVAGLKACRTLVLKPMEAIMHRERESRSHRATSAQGTEPKGWRAFWRETGGDEE